jgi:hypothetical protein
MAETGQLAAWVVRGKINEAFRPQEDGRMTRGGIAPN